MTPQELRTSILQLAIQGKLVEHFETDEAVVIQSSFVGDTSDFFEIPDNWMWLPIKDVASVNTGLSFKKQDQRDSSNGTLRVLRGGNIGDDYKYHLYDDDVYVELDQFQTKYIQLLEGDIITPSVTSIEKICKTGYINCVLPKVTAGGFVYIIRCLDRSIIEPKFLMYFIASSFNKEQCKPNIHKSGQAFYNLKKSGFIEQPICVPPLAEQKRIVAKIEELLPLIDRYEQAWSKLEEFNKRFSVDMQKSILQIAIQGKLVEQRPDEGSGEELFQQIQAEKQSLIKAGKIKKEKPLPEIAEDEVPFDIPESWKWVRLRSLGMFSSGKTPTMGVGENWDNGTVPWITSKDMKRKYLNSSEMLITEKAASEMKLYPANTILMVVRSGILKRLLPVAILTGDSTINQDIKALSLHIPVIAEFVYVILKGMETHILKEYRKQVTTVDSLRFEDFQNMPVPLPPLAEQKRIVAKLEEILPLCERLK